MRKMPFKDGDNKQKITYILAYKNKNDVWFDFFSTEKIEEIKPICEKTKINHPLWEIGVFEKFEAMTINELCEDWVEHQSEIKTHKVNVVSSEGDFYHFCSNCNNEVYKKDKYCHTCGSELKWRKNNVEL